MLVVLGLCLWAGVSLVAVSEDSSCRVPACPCWWCWGFVTGQEFLWLRWVRTLVAVCQLLIAVASLVAEQGLQGAGCSLCRGLIALQHVGSSWIRNRTHISCMGRQLLCHWAMFIPVLPLIVRLILDLWPFHGPLQDTPTFTGVWSWVSFPSIHQLASRLCFKVRYTFSVFHAAQDPRSPCQLLCGHTWKMMAISALLGLSLKLFCQSF